MGWRFHRGAAKSLIANHLPASAQPSWASHRSVGIASALGCGRLAPTLRRESLGPLRLSRCTKLADPAVRLSSRGRAGLQSFPAGTATFSMHARDLALLAERLSDQGQWLVRATACWPAACVQQYWAASKCRLDRWSRMLKRLGAADSSGDLHVSACLAIPHCEELLVSDLLTRVWCALAAAHDRARGTSEAEPIARSILLGHNEVRHRLLSLVMSSPCLTLKQAVDLNHLRRLCERWTDLLLARLAAVVDGAEFAHDPSRAQQFALDLQQRRPPAADAVGRALLQASLVSTFRRRLHGAAANGDLNARLASAILGCFRPELFDGAGIPHGLWYLRLIGAADDVQGLLDDLLRTGNGSESRPADSGGGDRLPRSRF
jgi:hypothetical protein